MENPARKARKVSWKTSTVIIIGSGPAGDTAAIYAARANMAPLVLHGGQPGGQLTTTTDVENYPGFPEGVQGPDLMLLFEKQAQRFGARYESTLVTSVDLAKRPFTIVCEDATYLAEALIIASGASPKLLGIPDEKVFFSAGFHTCATCDGAFYKGKELVVIGGGDSAMEEGTYLTRHATRVRIVHRRDKLRASKIMQDRALSNPKIEMVWDSAVERILGERGKVRAVGVRNLKTGAISEIPAQGVFIAIGHEPNTKFLQGKVELDAGGYVVTRGGTTATSVPGVFAAGDVADSRYRQAITAAGTGCQAALDAERFLELGH
ncbi:MAG: thioredoxin-disulfide reductase [Acidobacteriota bacterium]